VRQPKKSYAALAADKPTASCTSYNAVYKPSTPVPFYPYDVTLTIEKLPLERPGEPFAKVVINTKSQDATHSPLSRFELIANDAGTASNLTAGFGQQLRLRLWLTS
jgi:hypothetical protein